MVDCRGTIGWFKQQQLKNSFIPNQWIWSERSEFEKNVLNKKGQTERTNYASSCYIHHSKIQRCCKHVALESKMVGKNIPHHFQTASSAIYQLTHTQTHKQINKLYLLVVVITTTATTATVSILIITISVATSSLSTCWFNNNSKSVPETKKCRLIDRFN